ncbi:hypothetical protein [Myroides injenensis]|uniref:hypothetical protein n=1 Tax=Myroides injenensis TaxID=1183151 RepID=UPI000474EA2C|nr:hypothetical protein [Myroides injenensis]
MIAKIQLKLNNDVLLTVIKMVQQTDDYLVENVTDALLISVKEDLINKLEDKAKNIQKQVSILDHNKKHSMVLKYHEAYTLYKLLDAVEAKQLFNDSPHIKKIKRLINELHNKVDIFAKEGDFIDTEEEIIEDHNSEINSPIQVEPILFSFDFEQDNTSIDEIETTEQLELNAVEVDNAQDIVPTETTEQLDFNAIEVDNAQDIIPAETTEQLDFNAVEIDNAQDIILAETTEQLEFNAVEVDNAQDIEPTEATEQLEFNAIELDNAQDIEPTETTEQLEFNAIEVDNAQDIEPTEATEQLEFNAIEVDNAQDIELTEATEQLDFNAIEVDNAQDIEPTETTEQLEFNAVEVDNTSQFNSVSQPNFSEYFAIQKQGLSNVETIPTPSNNINESESELATTISNIKEGIEQAERETAKDVMQIEIFDVLDLDNKPLEKDTKTKADKKKEKKEKKSDSQEGQISLF